jgi:serine/threonine protein kinase
MGYHYSTELDTWLDGTVLMPKVAGLDWAGLSDEIRDGKVCLDELHRVTLCKNLTQLVQLLEDYRCAHRDFSCGNVFVDSQTCQVYLIDFDSLYHPSLRMPRATTCGTMGYTPHHAWNNGNLDPRRTWCEYADRYALALINVEFLLMSPGIKTTGEGGIFDQDELRRQSGTGINSIIGQLRSKYPHASQLLEATIHSSDFKDCPSPQDWNRCFEAKPSLVSVTPSLDDLNCISPEHFVNLLGKCRPAAPLWPAPSLNQMPMKIPRLPASHRTQGLNAIRRLYQWIKHC